MSETFYKVWTHIEMINEDEGLYEDTVEPVSLGPDEEFKTLEAAETARDLMLDSYDSESPMQKAFNDAINFALDDLQEAYDSMLFLKLWREGDWPEIREVFPEFKGRME